MNTRTLGTLARTFLEEPLFSVEPRIRDSLKRGRVESALRLDFHEHAVELPASCRIAAESPRKWVLATAAAEFVVRDRRGELAVARRKHPRLSRLITRAERAAILAPTRTRQIAYCELAALRKHVVDHPSRLLVNIGAGRWYARRWKVLDHQGVWYRYAPFFIDYDHDLTSSRPLPFGDRTVDLFYSEHVFEHLDDACCVAVFRELRRCLRDGGGARIVVPDAELIHRKFGERDLDFFDPWMQTHNATLTEAFLILVAHPREPYVAAEITRRHRTMSRSAFLDQLTTRLRYDPERAGEHINWFDEEKLVRLLRAAGFRRVEPTPAQQSAFAEMRGRAFDRRAWYSLHVDAWP